MTPAEEIDARFYEKRIEAARQRDREYAAIGLVPPDPLLNRSKAREVSGDALFVQEALDAANEVVELLVKKNAAYGNSALDPVRIFSKADTVEQLLVRIDDKLSRLARGSAAGEDVELDVLGYLLLLRIARRRAKAAKGSAKGSAP